jgi:two-component system, LytTR family, response regulator
MNGSPLRAVLIDDDPHAVRLLNELLLDLPKVDVKERCLNARQGLDAIIIHQPDLLFLDIEMPGGSGFDLLESLNQMGILLNIIFITGQASYINKAFEYATFGYILKPVNKLELIKAIERVAEGIMHGKAQLDDQSNRLKEYLSAGTRPLRFNTRTGFILINPLDIFWIKAEGNYCNIQLRDGQAEIVTQNLGKVMTDIISIPYLFKCDRSTVINLKYLYKVDKGKKECVMNDLNKILKLPVSRIAIDALDDGFGKIDL